MESLTYLMLSDTLHDTLQKYSLIPAEETVIVAVSGGADSLALLHALLFLQSRKRLQCQLHVATLNHGIRAQAAADVTFVQQVCDEWGVPCTTGQVDTLAFAGKEGIGIEAAARHLRYAFLAEVAEAQNATTIMTAHHRDDLAETILMHIIRGAGVRGLQGMTYKIPLPGHLHLTLIRPLLAVSRVGIEAYCQQHTLIPRHDESNTDTRYTRNRLRHEIIPVLKIINPQLDNALLRLNDIVSAEHDYLQKQFQQEILPQFTMQPGCVLIPRKSFKTWHPAMQRHCLRFALSQLAPQTEAGFQHIESAINIAISGDIGAIAEFPGGFHLRVGYQNLLLKHVKTPLPDDEYILLSETVAFTIPAIIHTDTHILTFALEKPDCEFVAQLRMPAGANLLLRTRQPGDKFKGHGMYGQHKKLKDWMIDQKIPRHLRMHIPLMMINNRIAAIILPENWLISNDFHVTKGLEKLVYCCCVKKL